MKFMRLKAFFICALLTWSLYGTGQDKAKAISYAVEIDLTRFNPEAAEDLDEPICTYEVDAYFTDQKIKTMVRNMKRPVEITIRQRQYDAGTKDEYNIDHDNKFILVKKDQDFKPAQTKNKKTILGYECREYTFTDYRGIQFSVWVTDKLAKNVCPVGNFSLKGTALEVTASNGIHYLATDFAEGQLDPGFFQLPAGYEQEIIMPPASTKKTK